MVRLNFQLLRKKQGKSELGESPVWDPETGDIWWVDIVGEQLLRLDASSAQVQSWQTPEIPGFVVLMASTSPAIGMQTGIFAFDPETANFALLVSFVGSGQRFNDATVDKQGRLWTSTMDIDAKVGCAEIQLVTDQFALSTVVRGLTIPNGLAVDLDRKRFFYSDSHPDIQCIWVRSAQSDSLELGEPVLFASTERLKGRPDGAALAKNGHYWIAGVDGSELYVFDVDGRLDTTIPVPFPAPTKLSFFGPGGRSVALTSKNIGEDGGHLALAELPAASPGGIVQPYWNAGVQ